MKCTNANTGSFNHECGRPAEWIGWQVSRKIPGEPAPAPGQMHPQHFCSRCKAEGDEARSVQRWERIPTTYRPRLRPAGYGTLPEGVDWEYAEAPDLANLYGVIRTSRPLTEAECARFDLQPVS